MSPEERDHRVRIAATYAAESARYLRLASEILRAVGKESEADMLTVLSRHSTVCAEYIDTLWGEKF